MREYTYTLILFCTVIVCFIASFDRRIRFDRNFDAFLKAAMIVAVPFITWDIWFTARGVWWFNNDYTLRVSLLGLPIEEWFFFICIPFACVFTYYVLNRYLKWEWLSGFNNLIVFVSLIVCIVIALVHNDKAYTMVTAVATIITLIFLHFIDRAVWISKASLVFLILMIGFFPVNGILTGTGLASPIVNYNPEEILGIRMGTIPIEDAVYGYTQFLLTLYFFKRFASEKDSFKPQG